MGCSFATVAFADGAIVNDTGEDKLLSFNDALVISADGNMIAGGPWLPDIASAISASEEGSVLTIDMGSNALNVTGTNAGHSTGIAAINSGKVIINSSGAMNVYAESTGKSNGQTAALFVNGGGQIFIHNDNNKITLGGKTGNSTNGAVVKAMNGVNGTRSYIKIDGLVDINADTTDGVGMSEAVSAVASTIDIGGGNIIATKRVLIQD